MKKSGLLVGTIISVLLASCSCIPLEDALDSFSSSDVENRPDTLATEDIIGRWDIDYVTIDGERYYHDEIVENFATVYFQFNDDSTFSFHTDYTNNLWQSDETIRGYWYIDKTTLCIADEEYIDFPELAHLRFGKLIWETGSSDGTQGKLSFSRTTQTSMSSVDAITSTTSPAVDGHNSYLLPTNTEYIGYNDLEGFTREEVMLIRNELYARHGYNFQDEKIRAYFNSQSWYEPIPGVDASTFDTAVFNGYERTNLETILAYEREMGWRS